MPVHKKWLGIIPELSRNYPGIILELSWQGGAGAAAPNPTSLGPGARMTVVKHTPSNEIHQMYTGTFAGAPLLPKPYHHTFVSVECEIASVKLLGRHPPGLMRSGSLLRFGGLVWSLL